MINVELECISNWIKANKLSLNIGKTSFMLFSQTATSFPCDILFDNIPINHTDCIKFLGLFIDVKLSWNQHVNYLCKLISRNVGIINKFKFFFPPEILYNIYNALILSYISYDILAWGNTSSFLLKRILVLQNRALRIIDHVDYRAHSNPLFCNHNTLKINDIYFLQLEIFLYQFFTHDLPNSFQQMFITNTSIHQHRTRQSGDLHIPYVHTSLAQKNINYQGPKYCNSLSNNLKCLKSHSLFKKHLKCMLMENTISKFYFCVSTVTYIIVTMLIVGLYTCSLLTTVQWNLFLCFVFFVLVLRPCMCN